MPATLPAAVVFDIDNTLTLPRRPLERPMAEALARLRVPFHVSAGSDLRLVESQLLRPLHGFGFRGSFEAFLCNGAVHYHCRFEDELHISLQRDFSLKQHIGHERFEKLLATVQQILDADEYRLPAPLRVLGERLVDRGSMLNITPIGRPTESLTQEAYENRERFAVLDRNEQFRARMLQTLNERLADIRRDFDVVITLGGETSFDLVVRGNDKRYALNALLAAGYGSLLYIGDALFPEGNDGAVLEFIELWQGSGECPVAAQRVTDWNSTLRYLTEAGLVARA